jgi:hypothetical protein
LGVAKFRERLLASKGTTQKFGIDRLDLRKPDDVEGTASHKNLKQHCSFGKD